MMGKKMSSFVRRESGVGFLWERLMVEVERVALVGNEGRRLEEEGVSSSHDRKPSKSP